MTNTSIRRCRQPCFAIILCTLFWTSTSENHHRSLSASQYRGGARGVKKRAFLPSQNPTLDAYLLQLRCGNSDYTENISSRDYGDEYYGGSQRPSSREKYDPNDYYGDKRYNNQGANKNGRNSRNSYYDDYGEYQDDYAGYSGDYYDDRGRAPSRGNSDAVKNSLSSLESKIKHGDRRIGVPLLSLGVIFTMLGISLFFNKSLMRLGNLMFIAGVPMTIGPGRTAGYFLQPEKTRATACLFAGIFLVFVGWPIVGIALEVFGILNLFGNMFPMFWAIVKNMPIVSSIANNAGSGSKGRPSPPSYDRDRYRDDPRGYYGDYRDDDRDDDAEPFY